MLAELPVSVDRYITSTARTKSTRTTLTYVRMIRAFFLYMKTNHEAFEDIPLCVALDLDDINFKSKSFKVIRKGNKEAEILFSSVTRLPKN